MPVFNSQNTILSSVRSIQNQNISDIEIILINDYSKDNSLKLIKNLQINDPRIKIINNKINKGTLYSRSIGVLISKGEFIFSLDNDDMFFNYDILDNIYNQAKIGNYDIVKFNKYYILRKNFKLINIKNINLNQNSDIILHQPKLGIYPISRNGKLRHNDYVIWDKCIKSNIYKKSINKIKKDIYNKIISWNEDIIILYIIFNNAKSFKITKKFGIIHIISKNSASFKLSLNKKIFCDIFFLDVIFKFSNKNINKNFASEYLIKNKRFLNILINKQNKIYLKNIIKKLINNKFITKNNKKKILKKYKKFYQ